MALEAQKAIFRKCGSPNIVKNGRSKCFERPLRQTDRFGKFPQKTVQIKDTDEIMDCCRDDTVLISNLALLIS